MRILLRLRVNKKNGDIPMISHHLPLTCSDSPDIPLTISGAEIRRKTSPRSPAMAFAKSVFPQSEGP